MTKKANDPKNPKAGTNKKSPKRGARPRLTKAQKRQRFTQVVVYSIIFALLAGLAAGVLSSL